MARDNALPTTPNAGLTIRVQRYKPSGKWYMDDEVRLPGGLNRYDLTDYIEDHYRVPGEYAWLLVIHSDFQPSDEATDYLMFPVTVNMGWSPRNPNNFQVTQPQSKENENQ